MSALLEEMKAGDPYERSIAKHVANTRAGDGSF